MAFSANRAANNAVTNLESALGFSFSPSDRAKAVATWQAVFQGMISEMTTNGVITLGAGNLTVAPGTFVVGGSPVTGQGSVNAATLTGKIS